MSSQPDPPEDSPPTARVQPKTGQLMSLLVDEVRRLAATQLRKERKDHTLRPTEIVSEAYLKLADQRGEWNGRTHFLAVASGAVRQVLVDHARKHNAAKRGKGERMKTYHEDGEFHFSRHNSPVDILALDESLKRLGEVSPRQQQVVELRFFGGLSVEEVAEVLAVSERTVKGDWQVARAWLIHDMKGRES